MKPRTRRPLGVIFLTVFLDLLGFGIVIPLLPFVAQRTGAGPFEVTLLMASYALMQLLLAPVWGRLSDRHGRRPILLVSIAGSVVGLLLFGFAESYLGLLAARVLHGAMNANLAVAQAYVADVTTPATCAKGMGVFGAAFGLGFVFGPAVGGFLAAHGTLWTGVVAAGFALVNLVLAFLFLPETRDPAVPPRPQRWSLRRQLWPDHAALRRFLVIAFLLTAGFSAMESTFAMWTERGLGWGATENAWFFAYLGVVIVVVQGGLVGPLRKRHPERALALAGLVVLALALATLPLVASLPTLLVVTAGLAAGYGLAQPSLSALVSFEADPGGTGETLGTLQGANALARVVGPLVAGAGFARLGRHAPILVGALLVLAALALLWRRVPSRRAAQGEG